MAVPDGVTWLWPLPLLTRRLPQAERWRAPLLALANAERARAPSDAPIWASDDGLHLRHPDGALGELADAIRQGVAEISQRANQHAWADARPAGLRIDLVGMWMQSSNRYARHDVHNHGNCSWSGVYYVDVDPPAQREGHATLGEANGLTRLHSPMLDRLGGAWMDLGAAWLQDSHVDLAPEPGLLVVWPSFLLHQVLPYDGERDRVIVSFNATVHGVGGNRTQGFGF